MQIALRTIKNTILDSTELSFIVDIIQLFFIKYFSSLMRNSHEISPRLKMAKLYVLAYINNTNVLHSKTGGKIGHRRFHSTAFKKVPHHRPKIAECKDKRWSTKTREA